MQMFSLLLQGERVFLKFWSNFPQINKDNLHLGHSPAIQYI